MSALDEGEHTGSPLQKRFLIRDNAVAKSYRPDVFEFSVLGLPNFDEISIIWDNGLTRYRGGEEREFYPSEEDWENFWKILDKIGAWSWRGEYINKSILDGRNGL